MDASPMLPRIAGEPSDFRHLNSENVGGVITLAEYRERYGLANASRGNRSQGKGGVPTNRLHSHYNSRQRKVSSSSSSTEGDTETEEQNQSTSLKQRKKKCASGIHAMEILKGLDELRKNRDFCDMVLVVDNQEIPAHKNVLSSFSTYFKAMFTGNLMESQQERVTINGVESAMLQMLIDYAYTGLIDVNTSNVQSLLAAANLLGVMPVRDSCCRFLRRHLDEGNCVGIHCFAEAHACTDLQDWAKQFMLSHFAEVAQHEELLSLSVVKLVELVSSEDLSVEREEVVFTAALKWLQNDREARTPEFHKVLEHVRLPLLNPYFLHDCVRRHDALLEEPQCRRLVEEAEWYHLMPDRRHEMQCCRTRPRKSTGFHEVIVAVGGEDDKVVLRSVEYFSPQLGEWRTLACLPFAVSKHGLVASGSNHMYLAGGEFPDGSASHALWRYDPVLDLWWEMAPMLVARSELGLAVLDGCVYAVGGWEGSGRLDSVERFDPATNTWEMIAPMKIAVTSPAVVAHGGRLYVTGGAVLEDGDGIELVQRYDPRTNTWTDLEHMLIPRSGSAACFLNGCIYVLGGWHASTENTNKVECYNIETNCWEFKASMCERRYRPGVAVVDGKIYILGGEEGWDRYHDTIECYCPEKDSWSIVGEMHTSRSWLSCVTLQLKMKPRESEDSCALLNELPDLPAAVMQYHPSANLRFGAQRRSN